MKMTANSDNIEQASTASTISLTSYSTIEGITTGLTSTYGSTESTVAWKSEVSTSELSSVICIIIIFTAIAILALECQYVYDTVNSKRTSDGYHHVPGIHGR